MFIVLTTIYTAGFFQPQLELFPIWNYSLYSISNVNFFALPTSFHLNLLLSSSIMCLHLVSVFFFFHFIFSVPRSQPRDFRDQTWEAPHSCSEWMRLEDISSVMSEWFCFPADDWEQCKVRCSIFSLFMYYPLGFTASISFLQPSCPVSLIHSS